MLLIFWIIFILFIYFFTGRSGKSKKGRLIDSMVGDEENVDPNIEKRTDLL